MTDEALRRAIRVCVSNAHRAGFMTKGSAASLQSALEYAEELLMPIVEARIEQGIEEAWQAAQKAAQAPVAEAARP